MLEGCHAAFAGVVQSNRSVVMKVVGKRMQRNTYLFKPVVSSC